MAMMEAAENLLDTSYDSYGQQLYSDLFPLLEHVLSGYRIGSRAYQSLRALDEVVGTQYGDRVIYELIQNAHDAHDRDDMGEIAVRLIIRSDTEAELYVANRGRGFSTENVDAIKFLASSNKDIGEGIGNKGLGFRSVELLTPNVSDVHIFSQPLAVKSDRFTGYCFRFASEDEVASLLERVHATPEEAPVVAKTVPRYLCPVPLTDQPDEIRSFARDGFATVIKLALRAPAALKLAKEQIADLAALKQPVLLFLERVSAIQIDVREPGNPPVTKTLHRSCRPLEGIGDTNPCHLYRVNAGDGLDFLMVRRAVEKRSITDAVQASIDAGWPLQRWLDWKGEAIVSVAVPWNGGSLEAPCLYNFLPMSQDAASPLHGYVDAPFYTDIDRRDAVLDLPLNKMLLTAVAEMCAISALALTERSASAFSRSAITDLVAWNLEHAATMNAAFEALGTSLAAAQVFPTLRNDSGHWGTLVEIVRWPDMKLSAIKPQKIASLCNAQIIPGDLSRKRIERIEGLARTVAWRDLCPTSDQLCVWVEALAEDLLTRKQPAKAWISFYDEIYTLFQHFEYGLTCLRERRVLLDKNNRLQSAISDDSGTDTGLYYRPKSKASKVTRHTAPPPPQLLSRRYPFLKHDIDLSSATAEAFARAGLLRVYDAIEALSGLPIAIGKKPSEQRRVDGLKWVFDVWRSDRTNADPLLASIGLQLPTIDGGWTPAREACFSDGWSPTGRVLEDFLLTAATISADCAKAKRALLRPFSDWPCRGDSQKSEWFDFLRAIGVRDGLVPVTVELEAGTPSTVWNSLLAFGREEIGFDSDWCSLVGHVQFASLGTVYRVFGDVWRLPGQIEYAQFDAATRDKYSDLVFLYLKAYQREHLSFLLDKASSRYDGHRLPSPVAAFIQCKPWVAVPSADETIFVRPDQCWSSSSGQSVPSFVVKLPRSFREEMKDDPDFVSLLFSSDVGFLDWSAPGSAVYRLASLAQSVAHASSRDLAELRRQCDTAWSHVIAGEIPVPSHLQLVVDRARSLCVITGDEQERRDVVVVQHPTPFQSRVLADLGVNVLHAGPSLDVPSMICMLNRSGGFNATSADELHTDLVVDGNLFVPSAALPTLASFGLDWLAEIMAVAHMMKSQDLERSVPASTILRRFRSIRVVQCTTFALTASDRELAGSTTTPTYGFEDERFHGLVTTSAAPFNWSWLARASDEICRLISPRLRAATPVLLQLALDRQGEALARPSDDDLATALGCDTGRLHEHLAELRSDTERLIQFLIPALGYYTGIECANKLRADAERYGSHIDVERWLAENASTDVDVNVVLSACREAVDLRDLRRSLNLDLSRLNIALRGLGIEPLTYEQQLRSAFSAYVKEFRNEILDRLRAHYLPVYYAGASLSEYATMKSLDFLSFPIAWAETLETLDESTAKIHIDNLLDAAFGADTGVTLPSLPSILEPNRRKLQSLVKETAIIVGAWCALHGMSAPAIWRTGDYQEVVKYTEDSGVLDFEIIDSERAPGIFERIEIWPNGMPQTLELAVLGLDEAQISREASRRAAERESRERENRTITFAGEALDPLDPEFPILVGQIAESIEGEWLHRSCTPALEEFRAENVRHHARDGRDGRELRSRVGRRLPESQRDAMGMVSERLALEYLRHKHSEFFDEDCWVSTYRRRFFGGSDGDDSLGYDFCVRTPTADWFYEVKSSLSDGGEFELTTNEMSVASDAAAHPRRRRYRILYVPFVFQPSLSYVAELPNPMEERHRRKFSVIGTGSIRLRFKSKD